MRLGLDPAFGNGFVKIVRPITSGGAKRKLPLVGRDDQGRLLLLREGRLHANPISRLVKDVEFATSSGLSEMLVMADGLKSDRHWYVVADLDASAAEIVSATARFANACPRARLRAGGGKPEKPDTIYCYGVDEKGGITTVTRRGSPQEIERLQGYVFVASKKLVGLDLKKPKRGRLSVDIMIARANLLIEIKTGIFPHNLYGTAVQLYLYPTLIGLPDWLDRLLLVPDASMMPPNMVAALDAAGVEIFTYSITRGAKTPKSISPPN